MTLHEFIKQENLIMFADPDSLRKIWNRIILKNVKKVSQYSYTYDSGKKHFHVTTKMYMGQLCYWAEIADGYGMYRKIPCNTRSEERAYPKSASWIGTLLVAKEKSMLAKSKAELV